MTIFTKLFKAKFQELRTMFLATGGLAHNGEKGGFREAFVKEIFELFLPVQFGVGSGVILDAWGKQSPQVDLIIYDKRTMPPILEVDGRGIYAFDSVLRALEVKSIVDQRALEQFSKLLWSLSPKNNEGLRMAKKGKLTDGYSFYPVCCLYGFSSGLSTLLERYERDENITGIPNMIFVDGVGLYNPEYPFLKFDDPDLGIAMFMGLILENLVATADSRAEYDPRPWLDTIGFTKS